MESINQPNIKSEIITLILADMRNRKLIMGLDAAGLSTDDFNTNLSELIFSKIGVNKAYKELMSTWYEDTIFTILDVELYVFREHQLFFAMTLYDAMKEKSRKLQTKQLLKSKSGVHFLPWAALHRFDN